MSSNGTSYNRSETTLSSKGTLRSMMTTKSLSKQNPQNPCSLKRKVKISMKRREKQVDYVMLIVYNSSLEQDSCRWFILKSQNLCEYDLKKKTHHVIKTRVLKQFFIILIALYPTRKKLVNDQVEPLFVVNQ